MFPDQETLRLIFGLKLRRVRQAQRLSLKELAKRTGLSPSYINEIEKGKKYPKADKIGQFASALNVPYDELTSIKLTHELDYLSRILEGNLLKGLPFDFFGIPAQTVFELVSANPKEVGAFIGTIIELCRQYNISLDDFLLASVSSYLDLNGNFFPEIEQDVQRFLIKHEISEWNEELLTETLRQEFGYEIYSNDFKSYPEDLHSLVFFHDREPGRDSPSRLFLNLRADPREREFILAREIGYSVLGVKERFHSSIMSDLESFEQLTNHTSANYFAGALLHPKKQMEVQLKALFDQAVWDASSFRAMVANARGGTACYFHRMAQILPQSFGMDALFFLRLVKPDATGRLEMTREMHLSGQQSPHRVRSSESYCRRWVTVSILDEAKGADPGPHVACQRSQFYGEQQEYFCFSASERNRFQDLATSMTLGIKMTPELVRKVKFVNDPQIITRVVSETCERCPIADCGERVAAPDIYNQDERVKHVPTLIEQVARSQSDDE